MRQAIADANATLDADTIVFGAGSGGTISLQSALPELKNTLAIKGPGATLLTVQGGAAGAFGIFTTSGSDISLEGLTVAGGKKAFGGAIFNTGKLTISRCVFLDNFAISRGKYGAYGGGYGDANGGAICNGKKGTLSVAFCTFTGNQAVGTGGAGGNGADGGDGNGEGGAIFSTGTLSVTDSVFTNNLAQGEGGYAGSARGEQAEAGRGTASGGAICVYNAPTDIVRCTFSDNAANGYHGDGEFYDSKFYYGSGAGGALSNYDFSFDKADGEASNVLNCSFFRNSANSDPEGYHATDNGSGGAIINESYYGYGILKVVNCSFDANFATNGGGIHNRGVTTLLNTLFNAGASGANLQTVNPDHLAAVKITSLGHNLSSDAGGGFLLASGDQIRTYPRLGSLQNNGGVVPTMALLEESPAIGKGSNDVLIAPYNLETDARGSGFARKQGEAVDIGAFESDFAAPVAIYQLTGIVKLFEPSSDFQSVAASGVEGATLELWQGAVRVATATSDSEANYRFANLAPGDYQLKGSLALSNQLVVNLSPASRLVTITDANVQLKPFKLFSIFGVVNVRRSDGSTFPKAGAVVTLRNSKGEVVATRTTGSDGRYVFRRLQADTYKLKTDSSGIFFANVPGLTLPSKQSPFAPIIRKNIVGQRTADAPLNSAKTQ